MTFIIISNGWVFSAIISGRISQYKIIKTKNIPNLGEAAIISHEELYD